MVAMVDPFEGGMELPFEMLGEPLTKDLGNLLCGQFKETELTGAFEEFVDGEGFAKDKVEAIFHLAGGIETAEVHGLTFSFGELGTQKKGPIIKAVLQQLRRRNGRQPAGAFPGCQWPERHYPFFGRGCRPGSVRLPEKSGR